MKNHKIVNGKLLQTNKKWSHLKQRQRTWIYEVAKEEYIKYIEQHHKQPRKKNKLIVIDNVYEQINQREIWIPFYEVKQAVGKFIDRLNRRTSFEIIDNQVVLVKAYYPSTDS